MYIKISNQRFSKPEQSIIALKLWIHNVYNPHAKLELKIVALTDHGSSKGRERESQSPQQRIAVGPSIVQNITKKIDLASVIMIRSSSDSLFAMPL